MEYQVIWSDEIVEDIRNINNYLLDEWGFLVADKFADKLVHGLEIIKANPHIGRKHNHLSAVRQLLITPHNLLCYTVKNNIITALNLTDSRVNI
ncbi:MAG: type II toxin-antitoxin system RelE/ParE family toxin [Arcicella sp.]|nr:type II toxin-antitoxin system RelE/ParE family toxin [Arcicella sp.]